MFEGFTQETSDFLWDLSFHNERPWFQAHREQFERCLQGPFKALAQDTYAAFTRRVSGRDFAVHISRIYRDARRLFGRGPYKDHLWFTLYSGDKDEAPCFWFEIHAASYSYGLGFWAPRPELMAQYRRSIDANPARFERIAAGVERLKGCRIIGEEYKRPKGDRGERLNRWYNRKYLAVEFSGDFGGVLLSPELPRILSEDYERLMPLYAFLMEVYESSREEVRS